MGNMQSGPKCDGCDRTTPFFGEAYGRMSENAHGVRGSGLGHNRASIHGPFKEYDQINLFKNKLLIPFYGTVIAIKALYAGLRKDLERWEQMDLSENFANHLLKNDRLKYWFAFRVIVSLVPIVGTVVNGALDIIAQAGLVYRNRNASSLAARELVEL